jgi:uncharacterized membrane protein YphA (DoxX/SURF4 family)
MTVEKMKNFAPAIVRIGVALVILWFGAQQLMDANVWTGLIPDWATSVSGFDAVTLVKINGVFEIIIGFLLLIGLGTRIVALVSALHLLLITFVVGYNGVGVRDFGLSMAAISSFLYGTDALCVDKFWQKNRNIGN